MLCVLIVAVILGCGETENPLKMEMEETAETGTLAAMKAPAEMAPGAPTAPGAGVPYVKEVGFYRDWKRTKPLTGTVRKGSTIYIKIVFSEGMKLVVTDDKEARPILYHKIGGKLRRFSIVGFKAKGKDFDSGDAKPIGNQATYYAKHVVKEADLNNVFTIAVGRLSVDRQGNTMSAFYTHGETLQCGPLPPRQDEPREEEPTEQPTDTVSPTVRSITHFHEGDPVEGELPTGATVETRIVFSEQVTPSITYTTGGKTKTYGISQTVGGIHRSGVCKPADKTGTIWLCRQNVSQPSFATTVTTNTADPAGNRLQEETTTEAVPVTERATTPQKPIEDPTQPPITGDPTLGWSFENDVYTVGGETYPGYNPSPNLQRILDTHPSAKLPFFIEAVEMVEVIDWVYLKSWIFYPNTDTIGKVRKEVLKKLGVTELDGLTLRRTYFDILPNGSPPPSSRYWLFVEYFRLRMQHPNKNQWEILLLFQQHKNNVVGTENPND